MAQNLSRRHFLLGLGSVAGASLLAACVAPVAPVAPAAGEAAAAPLADTLLEIEYWLRLSGDTATLLEALAAEFSEQSEGTIRLTSIFQGTVQELNQKVRAAAASRSSKSAWSREWTR